MAATIFDKTDGQEIRMVTVGLTLPPALDTSQIVPFLAEAAYEAMEELHPDFVEAIAEDFNNGIPEETMLAVNNMMGEHTSAASLLTACVEGTIRHIYANSIKPEVVPVAPVIRERDNTDELVDATFDAAFIPDYLRSIYRLIVQESAYEQLVELRPGIVRTHDLAYRNGLTLAKTIELCSGAAHIAGAPAKAVRLSNVAAEYIFAGKPNAVEEGQRILRERAVGSATSGKVA